MLPELLIVCGFILVGLPSSRCPASDFALRPLGWLRLETHGGFTWGFFRDITRAPMHWKDLGRATVGVSLVWGGRWLLPPGGILADLFREDLIADIALAAAALVSVTISCLRGSHEDEMAAPVALITTAFLAIIPPWVWILTVPVAAMIAWVAESLEVYFVLLGVGAIILGALNFEHFSTYVVACCLVVYPAFVSSALKLRFALPLRRRTAVAIKYR